MNGIRTYVLVVDDDRDTADSMTDLLALWGYDAVPRYCTASALAAVHARRPAAVLLDIGMPRMTGFEFAARLRQLPGCEDTPVVVVSGHTGEAHRARSRELGIAHYLYKPADPSLVRVLLGRLISGHQPPRPDTCRQRYQNLGGDERSACQGSSDGTGAGIRTGGVIQRFILRMSRAPRSVVCGAGDIINHSIRFLSGARAKHRTPQSLKS